jgi:hypothetical protein
MFRFQGAGGVNLDGQREKDLVSGGPRRIE